MTEPEHLYRYQKFNGERLRNLVGDNAIYLPTPKDFNDPWDCRPFFNTTCLNDPTGLERHIQFYQAVTRQHRPDISEEEIRERSAILRLFPDKLGEMITQISADVCNHVLSFYRVFCLSEVRDSILMWSHYAEQHKGVCLEFRCDNEIFKSAFEVRYLDKYPIIDLADNSFEGSIGPLISKSSEWSYEKEHRIIAQEGSPHPDFGSLVTKNGLLKIPDDCLSSIIVGYRMPSEDVAKVRDIISSAGNRIQLKRIELSPDSYHFRVVDFS